MKRLVLLTLFVIAVGAQVASSQPDDPFAAIARNAVEQAIRPGFEAYAAEVAQLPPAIEALCNAPGEAALEQAKGAFAGALEAWSRIEFVRFGPAIENDRLERTHFWPDPRGIGLRQVQALLAQPDESATSAESLAGKSVALQGFPALEFVLFGTGAEALATGGDSFRCTYAAAIAANLLAIARETAQAWRSEDLPILNPGPENPAYRTGEEATMEIVQTLATGLEIVAEFKLAPILGDDIDDANPRSAIFRRSGEGLASIRANTDGLRTMFEAAGFPALLAAEGHDEMTVRSVLFEFSNAERALASVTLPLDEAVTEPDARGDLEYAVIVLDSLRTSVGQTLPADLDLVLGFNSLDGD